MDRIENEKKIVTELSAKLQNDGFYLLKEKYKGEHYADFVKEDGEATFIFSIIFLKFERLNFHLTIDYHQIKKIYKSPIFHQHTFSVNLNIFLNPKNNDDYFHTARDVEMKYSDKTGKVYNLDKVCGQLYSDVFKKSVPIIIDKLNTIEKANALVNNIDQMFDGVKKIKGLIYSSSFPDEVLTGVLIALVLKPVNKDEILEKYLSYSEWFEKEYSRNEKIDEIKNLITNW